MKTINYIKKQVYGNDMLYIQDQQQAKIFQAIIGKKTITIRDIELFQSLFDCQFIQVLN